MNLISATSLETLAKLLLPIVLSILFMVFWWRAGSLHSIMERLWRIAAGNTPIKNRELAEFIETNREIEKFRFIFRLKIHRHTDLQRFIRWHKANGIAIKDIQFMRHWFDADEPDFIKSPKKTVLIFPGICGAIFLAMSFTLIFMAASSKAYLHMKSSGANFKSDGTTIESWLGEWESDASSCNEATPLFAKNLRFSADETRMICASFQDGSLKTTTEDAIKSQKAIGTTFGLVFCALSLYVFRELATALDAIQFPERLEKLKSKNSRNDRSHQTISTTSQTKK